MTRKLFPVLPLLAGLLFGLPPCARAQDDADGFLVHGEEPADEDRQDEGQDEQDGEYPAFWEDYGADYYQYEQYRDYGPFEDQVFPETLYGGSAYPGVPVSDSWTAHPSLLLRTEYHDNFTLAPDSRSPVETWVFIISPGIRLETSNGKTTFSVGYQFTAGEYADSPLDDFTAHLARADLIHVPTDRSALYLYAAWEENRDPRGTGRTEGTVQDPDLPPDEWRSWLYGGRFSYGSRARIELEADYYDKEYTNNRSFTRLFDREQWSAGAAFYYGVSPRTSLLARVRYTDIDYDTANLDSDETLFAIGGVHQATARTGFRAEVGVIDKEFQDPAIGSFDGIDWWSVGLTWAPKTYSIFDLGFDRTTEETTGIGVFRVAELFAASWTHGWRPRITTIVNAQFGNYEYVNSLPQLGAPRDDDYFTVGVRLNYQFRPWLFFGAGYRYQENDSTLESFDYDASLFYLELFGGW